MCFADHYLIYVESAKKSPVHWKTIGLHIAIVGRVLHISKPQGFLVYGRVVLRNIYIAALIKSIS